MTTLTDTQVITASGGLVELGYSQITSSVNVTSTVAGTGTEVIAPLTVVCDGGPVLVEFWASQFRPDQSSGGTNMTVSLFQDGSEFIRTWGYTQQVAAGFDGKPVHLIARVTPSAGSHTFGVRGFLQSSGTGVVAAGSGTTGAAPAFLRVSKIVQATQWPAVTTGTIICTSSTRPASPFVGQSIYETDTNLSYTYNGSAWVAPQVQTKPPMCINERTGQVINDATTTAIAFTSAASVDTETPTTIHSTSTNNTRFTARTAGVYQFHGSVVNSPASTIDVIGTIALRKNGTTDVANASLVSNAYGQNASVSALVDMSVGDYVELTVYQDNAANQTRTFTGRMQCALIGKKS